MQINNSKSIQSIESTDQITLSEIARFFQDFMRIIIGFMVFGFMGAALYLIAVPKQHEVSVILKIGQLASLDNSKNLTYKFIEEPKELITRLLNYHSYPSEVFMSCGTADQSSKSNLLQNVKVSIIKDIPGSINLRIYNASSNIAETCANQIFKYIKNTHDDMLIPHINAANQKLRNQRGRLNAATQFLTKTNNLESISSPILIFIASQEILDAKNQIDAIEGLIFANENRRTQLLVPIISNIILPNKVSILLIGLILGGFAGIFFAFLLKKFQSRPIGSHLIRKDSQQT